MSRRLALRSISALGRRCAASAPVHDAAGTRPSVTDDIERGDRNVPEAGIFARVAPPRKGPGTDLPSLKRRRRYGEALSNLTYRVPYGRPMNEYYGDPHAGEFHALKVDHFNRDTGLEVAHKALLEMLARKESMLKSIGKELSEEARAAALDALASTFDIRVAPVPPLLVDLHRSLGEISTNTVLGHTQYIKLLLRRANWLLKKDWQSKEITRRRHIARLSDPWLRNGVTWMGDLDVLPADSEGIEIAESQAARAFDLFGDVCVARVHDEVWRDPLMVGTLDSILDAAARWGSVKVAELTLAKRLQIELDPLNKVFFRLLSVARATGNKDLADAAWNGYRSKKAEAASRGGARAIDESEPETDYEEKVWAERIGFLIDQNEILAAKDLLLQLSSDWRALFSVEPHLPDILTDALVSQTAFRVTPHLKAFMTSCYEHPALLSLFGSPNLTKHVLQKLEVSNDVFDRLDDLNSLASLAIEATTLTRYSRMSLGVSIGKVLNVNLAAAFSPGISSKDTRGQVEAAMTIFTAWTDKYEIHNQPAFLHRMIDALALVGRYGDALNLIKQYIESARQNLQESESLGGLRLKVQEMVETAIGLSTSNTRGPVLQDILEGCAILFNLQPPGKLVLSNSLQQAVKRAISTYDAKGLTALMERDHGKTMYWISQTKTDGSALPAPPLILYSRCEGNEDIPPNDPMFKGTITAFYASQSNIGRYTEASQAVLRQIKEEQKGSVGIGDSVFKPSNRKAGYMLTLQEIQRRMAEGRCKRCGLRGHFVSGCTPAHRTLASTNPALVYDPVSTTDATILRASTPQSPAIAHMSQS